MKESGEVELSFRDDLLLLSPDADPFLARFARISIIIDVNLIHYRCKKLT